MNLDTLLSVFELHFNDVILSQTQQNSYILLTLHHFLFPGENRVRSTNIFLLWAVQKN